MKWVERKIMSMKYDDAFYPILFKSAFQSHFFPFLQGMCYNVVHAKVHFRLNKLQKSEKIETHCTS